MLAIRCLTSPIHRITPDKPTKQAYQAYRHNAGPRFISTTPRIQESCHSLEYHRYNTHTHAHIYLHTQGKKKKRKKEKGKTRSRPPPATKIKSCWIRQVGSTAKTTTETWTERVDLHLKPSHHLTISPPSPPPPPPTTITTLPTSIYSLLLLLFRYYQ